MKQDTLSLHAGYSPKNGEPRVLPIVQSTTFKYESTEEVQKLFDLSSSGFFYSRLANPTVAAVEEKIAAMEGGVGAICTCSGMSAVFLSLINILKAGDNVISVRTVYGGTYNLLSVTMKRMGISVTFVDNFISEEDLAKAFTPNTKAVFGETVANPTISVFDIEKFANAAHAHGVPLIVDNTFATPVLCKPFDFGADIVVYSTTKYMEGHATQLGGCVVDSGKFDWTNGNFPEFTEPDDSYHGVVYTRDFGNKAYIVKASVQMVRDLGILQSPQGAFYTNLGLETLPLRLKKHCENAGIVARFLATRPEVEDVSYPYLEGSPYKALAEKYLPDGCGGVIAFSLKGGREAGAKFIDSLQLVSLAVHVADIRSCVLHPASSTHRQLSDADLVKAGIGPGLIRLSVGCEDPEDIIGDLAQALEKSSK